MDCWINRADDPTRRLVHIAGRLSYAQLPDLLNHCEDSNGLPLVVDLRDLLTADRASVEALQRLQRDGATLVNVSPYMQLKLNSPVR